MSLIEYAPTDPDNYGQPRHTPIAFVVLHGSGLPEGATAEGEVHYLQRSGVGVSYHYYISKGGLIWQLVPDNYIAWHAGASRWDTDQADTVGAVWSEGFAAWSGLNCCSIGVGLESHNAAAEIYPEAQLAAARWLVLGLMRRYSIPAHRILTHRMISAPRKVDPVNFDHAAFLGGAKCLNTT